MHIPDGYLSPATVAASYALTLPMLAYSLKRVKKDFSEESLPLLSTVTALSFLVMMLNIPIPGGTSGHAIGAAVIAVLFNPFFASISLALVLVIQSFLFGDGGVTALAVNIMAMGFVAAFTGYYVNRLLKKFLNDKLAWFFSGYLSIASASLVIALILGIQPGLASDVSGKPYYFPFDLSVTIPAIVGSHILYFGIAEGLYTMIILKFIDKLNLTAKD
jgi:cobalt/nickel transport system permease protein